MTVLDSLPTTVHGAFKSIFYDAVMTVEVPVAGGDPFDPPAPTTVTYPCKAYVSKYSAYYHANSLVDAADRKVIVLAKSMTIEPVKGARITVNNVTFTIINYDDDGSNRSIWAIQGRM